MPDGFVLLPISRQRKPLVLVSLVMAWVVEQVPLEPFPVVGGEAARAQVDHRFGTLPVRVASSASMAAMCAIVGPTIGESGLDSARLAASSRRARCSSLADMLPTS